MSSHGEAEARNPIGETGTDVAAGGTRSRGTGIARFAGLTMVVFGVLQIIAGTAPVFGYESPDAAQQHAFSITETTWGWIHTGLGVVVGMAGMATITGQLWGRVVGIVLAALGVAAGFVSLSHHPAWSILGIALDIVIIWALCVFDEAASAASPTMLD